MQWLVGLWLGLIVAEAQAWSLSHPNYETRDTDDNLSASASMLNQYLEELDRFSKFWKGVYGLMSSEYKQRKAVWEYPHKDSTHFAHHWPTHTQYTQHNDNGEHHSRYTGCDVHNRGFGTPEETRTQTEVQLQPQLELDPNFQSLLDTDSLNSDSISGGEKRVLTCGDGVLGTAYTQQDVCAHNRTCTILELDCNGTIIHSPDFPPDIAVCKISKLRCYKSPTSWIPVPDPNKTSPDYEDVSMAEEGPCKPQKFWRGDDTNVRLAMIDLYTCRVQAVCDNKKIFGYQGFEFTCTYDLLVCDGRTINLNGRTSYPDTGNCKITKKACDSTAHNSCHDIKKVCTDRKDSILDGICANKEVHNITDCGLTANRCVPNTVVCGGKTYNARNYTGVLGLCERTVDVKCGATVITLENLCRISEITCNGVPEVFALQQHINDDCSVSKAVCFEPPTACTEHFFGCPGCYYHIKNYPCRKKCLQKIKGPACDCPVDKQGLNCQLRKKVNCKITPLPLKEKNQCKNVPKYSGSQICILADVNETISIDYKIECHIPGLENYSKAEAASNGMKYWFVGDELAISDADSRWVLRGSFVDFDRFYRHFDFDILIRNLEGVVTYTLNLAIIEKAYWDGYNRIYMENYIVTNVPGDQEYLPYRLIIHQREQIDEGAVATAKRWYQVNKDKIIPGIIIGYVQALVNLMS